MEESILKEFLLFDFKDWLSYGNEILRLCKLCIIPVLIFAIIIDKFSSSLNPVGIFTNAIIASFIIISTPNYYQDVTSFGFSVGDSLLKDQKNGIIAKWIDLKKRALKKAESKEEKESPFILLKNLISFDGTDVVEKLTAVLIFVCMMLIKVIYSVVYYSTYCTVGIFAVLSIFPFFKSYLMASFKSILYLIISAILISLILVFMNDTIRLTVNSDGFIGDIGGLAQIIVLLFVLLGSLKISSSIVSGVGSEGWAGNMGSMLGAGLAYKSSSALINKSISSGKSLSSATTSLMGSAVNPALGIAKAGMYMASRPLVSSLSGVRRSLSEKVSDRKISLDRKLGNESRTYSNNVMGAGYEERMSQSSKGSGSLVNGRYENALQNHITNLDGKTSIKKSINPVSHIKASRDATRGLMNDSKQIIGERLGMPIGTAKLSTTDRMTYVADRILNQNSFTNRENTSLTKEDILEGQMIANKISRNLERKS